MLSSDLVRRAREMGGFDPAVELCSEMADEIERLREALRTIADTPAWGYPDKWEDTPTELRHFARTALGEKE